jgi:hypothetical protein
MRTFVNYSIIDKIMDVIDGMLIVLSMLKYSIRKE